MKQTADVVDLLAAILRGAPALPGAACAQNPRLWDGESESDRAEAIELCNTRCPALAACANAPHNAVSGVVAARWHEWTPNTIRGLREAQRAS